jgi:proteasome accessory factor A
MLDRLVGMETEYALRFHPRAPGGRYVPNREIFNLLKHFVGSRVPLARGTLPDHTWFTANGGAFRFERNPFVAVLPSAGCVEGATPECRGPRQLLLYQRAQDVLLSRATASAGGTDGAATLLKNNRDAYGNSNSCHENYEVTVAAGAALFLWRLALVFLPLACLPLLVLLLPPMLLCVILQPALLAARLVRGGRNRLASALSEAFNWFLWLCLVPLMSVLEVVIRLTAFRAARRHLLAFLVSRPIIAGTGSVDRCGRFSLSQRANAVTSQCSMGAEFARSIFYFSHVTKAAQALLVPPAWGIYAALFRRRQRLQIAVGDSNMAQTAEFLKIGTTLLVLDAIEAGALRQTPKLRRPLRALHAICADPTLRATVRSTDGREWTGLDIQRFYLNACRRFVKQSAGVPEDAELVLHLWEETLDVLEDDPSRLVGKIDWVTKRHLLDAAGADSVVAKRKIDLRYHELSTSGYYTRLEAAGAAPTLVEPEEVLAAAGVPPRGTPASVRGQLIRDRAGSAVASWNSVRYWSKGRLRIVRLR